MYEIYETCLQLFSGDTIYSPPRNSDLRTLLIHAIRITCSHFQHWDGPRATISPAIIAVRLFSTLTLVHWAKAKHSSFFHSICGHMQWYYLLRYLRRAWVFSPFHSKWEHSGSPSIHISSLPSTTSVLAVPQSYHKLTWHSTGISCCHSVPVDSNVCYVLLCWSFIRIVRVLLWGKGFWLPLDFLLFSILLHFMRWSWLREIALSIEEIFCRAFLKSTEKHRYFTRVVCI